MVKLIREDGKFSVFDFNGEIWPYTCGVMLVSGMFGREIGIDITQTNNGRNLEMQLTAKVNGQVRIEAPQKFSAQDSNETITKGIRALQKSMLVLESWAKTIPLREEWEI